LINALDLKQMGDAGHCGFCSASRYMCC